MLQKVASLLAKINGASFRVLTIVCINYINCKHRTVSTGTRIFSNAFFKNDLRILIKECDGFTSKKKKKIVGMSKEVSVVYSDGWLPHLQLLHVVCRH